MRTRESASEEALRLLRLSWPKAGAEEILFFGRDEFCCSPLPKKYGIDKPDESIYNIAKEIEEHGSVLFSGVRFDRGYVNFDLSESGLIRLAEISMSEHPVMGSPEPVIELGCNAAYIHARLLHTANTAACNFLLPSAKIARLAMWRLMMAESERQLSSALSAAQAALDEHRRSGILSAFSARIMASALYDLKNRLECEL